jgi:hypothetical protein
MDGILRVVSPAADAERFATGVAAGRNLIASAVGIENAERRVRAAQFVEVEFAGLGGQQSGALGADDETGEIGVVAGQANVEPGVEEGAAVGRGE